MMTIVPIPFLQTVGSVAWRLRRLQGPVRSWGADVIVIVILIKIYGIVYFVMVVLFIVKVSYYA